MKSDIEINRECNILNINEVAKKINISEDYLECYGKYKTKINLKENVNYINDNFISNCLNLNNININVNNNYYVSINGVLYNKDKSEIEEENNIINYL